jgi:hypothetical protein
MGSNYNLKLGEFFINQIIDGDINFVKVSPLSQEEIADGWKQVLPKARLTTKTHQFKIYLSQLPPHLWGKIKWNTDIIDTYPLISDRIYKYTVKKTKYDLYILQLYKHINQEYIDFNELQKQVEYLQSNHVKGWVIMKALSLLNKKK